MSLEQKILENYKLSMINKTQPEKGVLNYLISQIKYKKIEKGGEVDDADVIGVIKKEIKARQESLEYLQKAGKIEDIEIEIQSIEILKKYLPKTMEEKELKGLIEKQVGYLGITDLRKERGRLIASLMENYKTVIDTKMMNEIINKMI